MYANNAYQGGGCTPYAVGSMQYHVSSTTYALPPAAYQLPPTEVRASRRSGPFYLTLASTAYTLQPTANKHHESHTMFLSTIRPQTPLISAEKEVHDLVVKTFNNVTKQEFPSNLSITVCTQEELKAHYGTAYSTGIEGFSINKQGKGHNEIFVKEAPLDKLLLVIGHEIGHVMTPTLPNQEDEEAKAFAFERHWVETIVKEDIAHLSHSYTLEPARNGLHDVAFAYVQHLITSGKTAISIFRELVLGTLSIHNTLEYRTR